MLLTRIVFRRVLDMNDRALRQIVVGLGGKKNGNPREDGFIITVASEVMAILCLADSLADLKARLSRIVVAYDLDGNPVTAGQLKAVGSMAALLKDAIKPNLIQTLENTPCIMHGGNVQGERFQLPYAVRQPHRRADGSFPQE